MLREFSIDGMEYRQLNSDCSIFLKMELNRTINIFLAYVDDLILISTDINVLASKVLYFFLILKTQISH